MRELGGGGFTVRPLSQFTPASAPAGAAAGPSTAEAADPDADPRGNLFAFGLHPHCDGIFPQVK
jgi:hypothetical protein